MREYEKEYRDAWSHIFEADPGEADKFYVNVAYPYPSGAMHVGHGRTYIVPDVIARYYRMRGKHVLFPMAFHVTGTPVIGISRRIANGDEKTIKLYRDLYRVPEDVLEKFVDPDEIVRYFSSEYERIMRNCGLSIDWRRRFTTVYPQYSKFIEWQYLHLMEGNHVVRGAHPVKYCPQCDNPVGDHDLLEGEKAEIVKFVLIMFKWNDFLIPCATLRPETTYGVTNLWINPDVIYRKVLVDGQKWILSPEAAKKIGLQDHVVEDLGEIKGSELVDQTVSNPFCGEVPVLPATFVDPNMATGIVMSVPAHAPFDYIALRDLQSAGKYTSIKPVPLIVVEGYGECPARDAVERSGIKDQNDPGMETLTQEVYSAEFSGGRMLPQYGGKPVKVAREEFSQIMLEQHGSHVMYEFDVRNVMCRCGGTVYVRILKDQWFLQYSDPVWKEAVHEQLKEINIVPAEVRAEFDRTIDWLNDWACTRRVGLGTKLPWDKNWLVEPLSDSTIYMAFYTIAHKLIKLEAAKLTPEVFDYIFLGKGSSEGLPLDKETVEDLRSEFLYWYPYDFRFSAKDLISNHLTFQLFHHKALFPKELQPRGMVVFGMGLLEGAKMSSSKGNVILLEDAVEEVGADTVRMFLVGSAEPWQDFDWRRELVSSTRKQIERFINNVEDSLEADGEYPIDTWLISRMQEHIKNATAAMNSFQTRQALQEAYFAIESDLKWYRKRLPGDVRQSAAVNKISDSWIRLLAPFIPFSAQKLWEEIGGEGQVAFSSWPEPDESLIDPSLELAEELLSRTVEDIDSIMKLIQIEPSGLTLFISPDWKFSIFEKISMADNKGKVISEIMKDEDMRKRGKSATDAAKQITNLIHRLPPEVVERISSVSIDEEEVFESAREFIEKEFGLPLNIVPAEESTHQKAQQALPFKPAIVIE
ncbi:leucyl-tRNA synthetase [Methanolacinia petrolearia DSM 11571]|uniref:Leucine--tRNA ligase n=1 Tax=Methanolacinia petrolearia (strain DSM 11571 / OCM 486 / SEBR 4847) TaxID=679926 RepID=E1RIA1_METP4|nr:leucyl-tRNA synthetase [Methanolacinia petrolearia DSM 11571]